MSFQPIIPFSGYTGWKFLNRTMTAQKIAFEKAPEIKRDVDYFKANIGKINTAAELVADRRLLSVALGAFGLDSDLKAKAFIEKVLQEGTLKGDALANKLTDKRYLELSATFGFGDFATPSTKISDFGQRIVDLFQARQFETAVGSEDGNLRLAMSLPRDLGALAAKTSSENTKWFTIMGNPPLRKVFETAFNLPASFGQVDVDKQLVVLKARAEQTFGNSSVSQFKDPAKLDELVKIFLLRGDLASANTQTSRASSVLSMLQSGQAQFKALIRR